MFDFVIIALSKGGDLIRYFTKEGPRATEELLKEQIPLLLYRKGEGQMVRRSDYLKWKYRKKRHVSFPQSSFVVYTFQSMNWIHRLFLF